jgi:hypothetical protein
LIECDWEYTWSLRFKLEVFIWRHVVNVQKSSTTFRGILTLIFSSSCMCKRCRCTHKLHKRPTGVCVKFVSDSLRYQRGNHNQYMEEEQTTQWPNEKVQKDKQLSAQTSDGRLCKVCQCIGTVYTCMNSWKEPFNTYNSSMQYWT